MKSYVARRGGDWYMVEVPDEADYSEVDRGTEGYFENRIVGLINPRWCPYLKNKYNKETKLLPYKYGNNCHRVVVEGDAEYVYYPPRIVNRAIILGDIALAFRNIYSTIDEVHECEDFVFVMCGDDGLCEYSIIA